MQAMEIFKSNFDFSEYAQSRRIVIEEQLAIYMQDRSRVLWQSMAYSVLSSGKRLRALLCLASAEACSGKDDKEQTLSAVLPLACSIELIHAMSLIHDDLPALDNDDLRRGKPTNHKVFGEAIALLAGDALLMMAMEIIIDKTPAFVPKEKILSVALELSRAAGASGMVGGQIDDLWYTGKVEQAGSHLGGEPSVIDDGNASEKDINESVLASIHKRKTGALIHFAAWSGAQLAGGSDAQINTISEYAEILGLAFQIADDILDTTGDVHTLGKTPGKDEASNKATWVTVFGKEESERRLTLLEQRGLKLLKNNTLAEPSALALGALLSYAVHRKH